MIDPAELAQRFDPGFRWSAATAAFQIEGARREGGRGRSIWDVFVETPGRVLDGSTAEPGPDSFHRWSEDVALLAELGVDRYRFSISWARVQPEGSGKANAAGLAYYDRLVDGLLDAGLTPFPTLYHWDLPATLEAEGGWLSRSTAERFAEYTLRVAEVLGDRVQHWYTINEPVSTALQGYAIRELAPGKQLLFGALPAVHHQLLAHGLAMDVLAAHGATHRGIVNNHTWVVPASDKDEDLAAAGVYDAIHNRLFADPLLRGEYPDLSAFGAEMPVHDGDMAVISRPAEFYGVNFYNPTTVGAAGAGDPLPFAMLPTAGAEVTGFGPGWPIVPDALRALLVDLGQRYGNALPPLIVGENGASFPEPDAVDGPVQDTRRIAYLAGHIGAVADAIAQGANVEEYTVWSLLDNFEWAHGFTQRFGIVHVDHERSTRTPKASYDWYRTLIEKARA